MTTSNGDSFRWYEESHPKINLLFQLSCHCDTCLNDMVIRYRNEAVGNIPVYQNKGNLECYFASKGIWTSEWF